MNYYWPFDEGEWCPPWHSRSSEQDERSKSKLGSTLVDTYDPFIVFGDDSDVEGDDDEHKDDGDDDASEQGDDDGGDDVEFAFGEWTVVIIAVSDAWLAIPMATSAILFEEEGEQEPDREKERKKRKRKLQDELWNKEGRKDKEGKEVT